MSMDKTFPKRDSIIFDEPTKPEPVKKATLRDASDRPVTIMSEADAYISERIKEQPTTDFPEVELGESVTGIHRLSLPDYFEPLSYDCTRGFGCEHHGWETREVIYELGKKMKQSFQGKHGKFVFRWLNKKKRALDNSINIKGWRIVNRAISDFMEAPNTLFSVNGGVENGDSILGYMSIQKAMKIRNQPSVDSINRIKSEETKHENNPNFYKAKLSPDKPGRDDAPADALQEGRDF